MSRRYLRDDPSRHHFISYFPACPVADRTLFGLGASQRKHLAGLFCRDLRWSTWSWAIAEPFAHGHVIE